MRGARTLLAAALCLGGAALGTPTAAAQDGGPSRAELLELAFKDVNSRHRLSTGKVDVRGSVDGKIAWLPAGYATIVSDQGFLLAVSEQIPADRPIRIHLATEKPYATTVVARDERWNLVLLKIQPEEWVEPIDLATRTRSAAGVGEWAISVGPTLDPLAVGAISALNRAVIEQAEPTERDRFLNRALASVYGGRRYRDVLQHDTTLGRDMLGAPLVDSHGRFLGITVETRSRGTNYAVPAHRIAEALPALLRGRSTDAVRPGFIGISAGRLTRERAQALGIPGGVPVAAIIDQDGREVSDRAHMLGAGKAGVLVDDVIVKVDGRPVLDIQTLQEVVQLFDPGEEVLFTVLRNGVEREYSVTIAAKRRE